MGQRQTLFSQEQTNLRNNKISKKHRVNDDILQDVFDFLTRRELANGPGLVSHRLHQLVAGRLYRLGRWAIPTLLIRKRSSHVLGLRMESKNKVMVRHNHRERSEIQKLPLAEVPPPANILGADRVCLLDCRMDSALLTFIRQIASLPLLMLELIDPDKLLNSIGTNGQQNSLDILDQLLCQLRRCQTLRLSQCCKSPKIMLNLLSLPSVLSMPHLVVRRFKTKHTKAIMTWLHKSNGCGWMRMVSLYARNNDQSFNLLATWIKRVFRGSSVRRAFFLQLFFHQTLLLIHPVGPGLLDHALNSATGEQLALAITMHPERPKWMVLYVRRGPQPPEDAVPRTQMGWHEQWNRDSAEASRMARAQK